MAKLTLIPDWLSNSTLLLDTNFFIDSYHKKDYGDFLNDIKKSGIALVSPNFVKYEFIRSRTIDVVRDKERYFHQIIDNVLPYDPKIDELIIPTIEEYKQYMKKLPLVDLVLATYLKRYRGLYLLTRDHTDFPTTVFTREYVFNIESFREKLYAIYSYRPKVTKLTEAYIRIRSATLVRYLEPIVFSRNTHWVSRNRVLSLGYC